MYKRRFFLPLLLILSIALLGAAAQAEDVYVVPGGQSVGVAVATEGLVVIGNSDLGNVPSPARLAGLRAGDRLLSLDGEEITSAEHLDVYKRQLEQYCPRQGPVFRKFHRATSPPRAALIAFPAAFASAAFRS